MIIDIEKEKSKKVMQNGFSSLNLHLIVSWFYTLCDMFFGLYLCLLIPYFEITVTLMCVLDITIIICCLRATLVNTIDDLIVDERQHKERKQEFKTDVKNYCKVCEAHVRDKTKHCGQCNKQLLNYFLLYFIFSLLYKMYLQIRSSLCLVKQLCGRKKLCLIFPIGIRTSTIQVCQTDIKYLYHD